MPDIVNATPHMLHFYLPGGQTLSIPKTRTVARCDELRTLVGQYQIDGIDVPVFNKRFTELRGLPAFTPGDQFERLYVVSAIAAAQGAREGRADLIIVDGLVRDGDDRVIGASSFARLWV